MILDVKPFDDRQWGKLQEEMKTIPTAEHVEKMRRIKKGVSEVSSMVEF